ncbi:GNAT family N-acetyltransferase [Altererythrobacter salegens]|uniref:GNAT family N-acetyltransferase n=1 Tax=Croceibacterium salegens TaxID=1737568 RepID=A0A6I4T092_9SPHN|nr:GNAT family N-acetyltransferase [Croceibacterium salegens]
MNIRIATPDDATLVAALGRDSFLAAFEYLYSPEDLDAFLGGHKTEEAFAAYLAKPGYRTAIAEIEGVAAGYCMISMPSEFAEHSDARRPMALQQLYTAPGRTGAGIGAALMDWALGEARAQNADAVQLSVWSGNHGAQRFYARYGFANIADIEFWVGNQCDEEFLFELRL